MRSGGLAAARVRWAALMLLLWFSCAFALDRYGGSQRPHGSYDAVVVAGAGVLPGGRPGRPLVARTEAAAALYHNGFAPRIVLTGGVGEHPPAESEVAARMLRERGIPDSVLLLDRRSTSTDENAEEARRLLGDGRVLVVTDRFHALRTRRVFARRFRSVDVVGVRSHPIPRLRGALREVLAVSAYALLGRL